LKRKYKKILKKIALLGAGGWGLGAGGWGLGAKEV